jgi:FKBP-type peptidyl-prolyl cis-trans isomerase
LSGNDEEARARLQVTDLSPGTGERAQLGRTVAVHYVGRLPGGAVFDQSRPGEPFELTLGHGEVIEGWDEGLVGMAVGGVRRLIVPPQLAYGDRGVNGVIPPGATLEFEVELLRVD